MQEDGTNATILLQDLTTSHRQCEDKPVGPSFQDAKAFVAALAKLHAAGSKIDQLKDIWIEVYGSRSRNDSDGRLASVVEIAKQFKTDMNSSLNHENSWLLGHLDKLKPLLSNLRKEHTIIHGDAHYWNALYSTDGQTSLIDWGNACMGIGEIDLAHALALNLSRQVRQQWEAVLLELYTETLNLMGVDRELDVTRNRYRIAALYGISEPIGIWHAGFPSSVWLPLLTNALDAAADLDVAGLLH